MFLFI